MSGTTARLGLTTLAEGDPVTAYLGAVNNNANKLDSAGLWISGVAASRPAASIPGRRYYATDTGAETLDIGSAWVAAPLGAGSITAAMLASGSVTASKLDPALNLLLVSGQTEQLTLKTVQGYTPTIGPSSAGVDGGDVGIGFATVALYAWIGYCIVYTDSGHTTIAATALSVGVRQKTSDHTRVELTAGNNNGATLHPVLDVYAIGY